MCHDCFVKNRVKCGHSLCGDCEHLIEVCHQLVCKKCYDTKRCKTCAKPCCDECNAVCLECDWVGCLGCECECAGK